MIGGALLGFVVSLIVIGIMLIISSKKKPSWDAAVKRNSTFSLDMEPAAAIARLKEAAPAAGLSVALEDDGNNRLILNETGSMLSFGNFVPVSASAAAGGSQVSVGLTTKVPQWGPVVGKKHEAILGKIKAALGAAA